MRRRFEMEFIREEEKHRSEQLFLTEEKGRKNNQILTWILQKNKSM